MKTKILFLLTVFVISLTGCRFWGVRGSGDIEKETRDVDEFYAIESSGAFEINVRVGHDQRVVVTADDNLLKYVVTKVRGGKLIIDSKRDLNSRRGITIDIEVEELEYIESSGACNIYVDGIHSENFEVSMSGASDIDLEGETDKLYVELSGAGSVRARELIANDVKVDISGAASATVYAKESLDAGVSGVGSVNYYGNPDKVISDVSGVGSITRK